MQYGTSINNVSLSQWIAINEGEGLSNLYKLKFFRSRKLTKNEYVNLYDAWLKIFDEKNERYGRDNYVVAILAKKKQIFKLNCEYIKTGLEYHRTAIRALEQQLYYLENPEGENTKKIALGQVIGFRVKELAFQVDFDKMTVKQYYDLK